MKKSTQIDLTQGPFLKKIIWFSIPIVLTHILSNFYNTADLIVVGSMRGDFALAAVGATTSFMAMMGCIFMGMSAGVSVLVAQRIGARDYDQVEKAVHSSVVLSVIVGVVGGVLCFCLTPTILRFIDVPEAIFDDAVLYARIIYLGYPASAFYNYSAAAVRAYGDTRRPLIILTISGITNVILNFILVTFCGMSVEGVAIATVVANYLSAALMLRLLLRHEGCLRVSFRKMRLDKSSTLRIMGIGIPSGIQSAMFNLSNMMVQSSVNALGEIAVAGNTAGANIENYPYVAQVSIQSAAMTFVGQNVGAKKYKNVKKILIYSLACAIGVCLVSSVLIWIFREFLVGLYVTDAAAMEYTYIRLFIMMFITMVLPCSCAEMFLSVVRAMGKSATAMAMALGGAAVRLLWVLFIVPLKPDSYAWVIAAFPVSTMVVLVLIAPCYFIFYRKMSREAVDSVSEAAEQPEEIAAK